MIRPSFVPPPPIRRLRDVTRYRIDLVTTRTAEKQRAEKLLEDACIKLSVVASDIFGVSGRAMMASLIAGERDPKVLAQLARTAMRRKISALEEAFTGHFTDHHAFLLAKMLARVDAIDADLAELDAVIEQMIAPFASAAERLDEVTGIGPVAAAVIIAEIGTDMTRFPTSGHLVSWAKFAPGVKESAGKKKGRGTTGHGNPYLARVLGEAAIAASRTDTFLGERFRRIARRRGAKKAIVAVGRSILVIIWHLLSDPDRPLHRPRPRLLRRPHQPQPQDTQPRPPARSPRLQSHPRTRRLTASGPAPLTLRQKLPRAPNCPIFGLAEGRRFDPAPDHRSTSNLRACDQAKRFSLPDLLSVACDRGYPLATVVRCPLGHAECTTHDLLDPRPAGLTTPEAVGGQSPSGP